MQRRTERRAGPMRLISGHFPACAAGWLSGLTGCGQVDRKVAHPAVAASGCAMPAYGNRPSDRVGSRRDAALEKKPTGPCS